MRLVAEKAERLDVFLTQQFPDLSRSKVAEWIKSGSVLVDGATAKPSRMLHSGAVVECLNEPESTPHDLTPVKIPLDIRYEDEHLIVVNKPRGLAVHPAVSLQEPSLVNALLAHSEELSRVGGDYRPGIVHRLDKETTGVMLVAKNDVVHRHLAKQIETKAAGREYLAVVHGTPTHKKFVIDAPIGRDPRNRIMMAIRPDGKFARTHVQSLEFAAAGTLVYCKLETGRTHQIRVHLSSFGHPVVGDKTYGKKDDVTAMQLHAARITFEHPISHQIHTIEAPLPEDFLIAPGRDLSYWVSIGEER
jgi:23S rRNA pseudouridine1911/1915/1917 synthase